MVGMATMGSQGGRFSSPIAVLAALVRLTGRGAVARPAAATGPVRGPASLVDPFIGTSGGVNAFPGADVPSGMVRWRPDTIPDRTFGGAYDHGDHAIQGSLTHLSRPGCGAFGDVPVLPTTGP
jgi:putative alpha-1,2-mannosidase